MKVPRQSIEPEYLLDPLYDADGVQVSSGIGKDGREYPDPVPMSPPVGYEPPSTLEALIESVLHRRDFVTALRNADVETPDEADDFEVDEDEDPRFPETLYEMYFEAKSRRAAQLAARQAEANQRASADSVSEASRGSSAEKPNVSGSIADGSPDKSLVSAASPVSSRSSASKSDRSEDSGK